MPRVRARRSVRSASRGQQPANEGLLPSASPSSLAELKELSVQVLRLRCEQAHLVSSGSKAALVDRLAQHFSLADGLSSDNVTLASLASQVAQLQRQLAASSHEAGSRKSAPSPPPPQEPPLLDLRVSSPGPLALSPALPAPVVNTSPDGFTAGTALGLSSRTTEAIIRGEFISFSLLLAELAAGSPAFSAHSLDVAFDRDLADETFSLAQDRDSGSFNLIRTSSSAKPRVTDLHSWLQAWTAYLIVRSTASPDLTSQLLAYQRTIVEAAAMYRPAAWLNYDVAFRRQASANSSTRWDAIALDLWTVRMAPGAVNPYCPQCLRRHPRPSEECFRGHSQRSAIPPSRPAPNNPRFRNASEDNTRFRGTDDRFRSGTDICMDFQRRRCFRPMCVFRHVCRECAGNHPLSDCPRSRAAGGTAPTAS